MTPSLALLLVAITADPELVVDSFPVGQTPWGTVVFTTELSKEMTIPARFIVMDATRVVGYLTIELVTPPIEIPTSPQPSPPEQSPGVPQVYAPTDVYAPSDVYAPVWAPSNTYAPVLDNFYTPSMEAQDRYLKNADRRGYIEQQAELRRQREERRRQRSEYLNSRRTPKR